VTPKQRELEKLKREEIKANDIISSQKQVKEDGPETKDIGFSKKVAIKEKVIQITDGGE
jgi:hypothetical protein